MIGFEFGDRHIDLDLFSWILLNLRMPPIFTICPMVTLKKKALRKLRSDVALTILLLKRPALKQPNHSPFAVKSLPICLNLSSGPRRNIWRH